MKTINKIRLYTVSLTALAMVGMSYVLYLTIGFIVGNYDITIWNRIEKSIFAICIAYIYYNILATAVIIYNLWVMKKKQKKEIER